MQNQEQTSSQRILDFIQQLNSASPQKMNDNFQIEPSLFQLFKKLTKNAPLVKAKQASKEERTHLQFNSNSFSYGEIVFESISMVFQIIKKKHNLLKEPGGIFYDLGSGVGKGVIAASLLHSFESCKGIELLHSLHKMSLELKEIVLRNQVEIEEEISKKDPEYQFPSIDFIQADLIKEDWSDGTFIFASATCYDPIVMDSMCHKGLQLQKGSFFITLTKQLHPQDQWDLIDQMKVQMSWGDATLYIQIRK